MALLAAPLVAPLRPARAQPLLPQGTLAWLDAGGARVQQPRSALRNAGTMGGGVWHGRSRWSVAAEGAITLADDSLAAAQWVLRTSLAPATRLRTDLDLVSTTNGLAWPGSSSGSRSVAARQSVLLGPVTLHGSAGVGRTDRYLMSTRGHAFALGGDVQRVIGRSVWRLGVSGQRSFTDDWMLMEASGIVLEREVPAYTLDDVSIDLAWRMSRWALSASRSWRQGAGATLGRTNGFSVTASWQLSPALLLMAQGGEQLADVVRGVPQARYTGAALRWNPLRVQGVQRAARGFADARSLSPDVVPELRGDEVVLQRREGRGVLALSIIAAPDAVVEVATSANEWTPVRIAYGPSGFTHVLTLPSGTHKVAVRINGGAWRAPRGLVSVDDEFGGQAGLVVVP